MAEDDDPRWNAATDRIAHRLEDSVAPAQASPATPVITEDTVFEAIFAEEEPVAQLNSSAILLTVQPRSSSEEEAAQSGYPGASPLQSIANMNGMLPMPDAQMDFYNQEEFKDWPVGPEEDYLAGLLIATPAPATDKQAKKQPGSRSSLGEGFFCAG